MLYFDDDYEMNADGRFMPPPYAMPLLFSPPPRLIRQAESRARGRLRRPFHLRDGAPIAARQNRAAELLLRYAYQSMSFAPRLALITDALLARRLVLSSQSRLTAQFQASLL